MKRNEIVVEGAVAWVAIRSRDGSTTRVAIDASDVPLVSAHCWHLCQSRRRDRRYAETDVKDPTCRRGWRHLPMHVFLGEPADGEVVDHANGDGLDNRRANLRRVAALDKARDRPAYEGSRTGLRGVSPTRTGGFEARVGRAFLGTFKSAAEAAEAAASERRRLGWPERCEPTKPAGGPA